MSRKAITENAMVVRQYDHDRFVVLLFTPPSIQEDLFTLFAFFSELSKIPDSVLEPMMGALRYQWWSDQIMQFQTMSFTEQSSPLSRSLKEIAERYSLSLPLFLSVIESREKELQNCPFLADQTFMNYIQESYGTIMAIAMKIVGGDEQAIKIAEDIGTVMGIVSHLRYMTRRARKRHFHLPLDLMGTSSDELETFYQTSSLYPFKEGIKILVSRAETILFQARMKIKFIPPQGRKLLLSACQMSHYLKKIKKSDYDLSDFDVLRDNPIPFKLLLMSFLGRF